MHGSLRIFRTGSFDIKNLERFLELAQDYENPHLLVSDGILLSTSYIKNDLVIQRILTSNQLQKILIDMDDSPCYIIIASSVIESWKKIIVESIYDILKAKSYRGAIIFMNIVGKHGIFEFYFGKRVISEEGFNLWVERYQQ